jgi:hypothetical protein
VHQALLEQVLTVFFWWRMKPIMFLGLLWGIGMGLAQAQGAKPTSPRQLAVLHERRRPVTASITFLKVADGAPLKEAGSDRGILNLGSVSNAVRSDQNGAQIRPQKDSFAVSTRLGLRIDLSNAGHAGTATVSACLLSTEPLRAVWLDGVQLSVTPGVIAGPVSYGVITEHVLKIVVPTLVPPVQMVDLIGVFVTPN